MLEQLSLQQYSERPAKNAMHFQPYYHIYYSSEIIPPHNQHCKMIFPYAFASVFLISISYFS